MNSKLCLKSQILFLDPGSVLFPPQPGMHFSKSFTTAKRKNHSASEKSLLDLSIARHNYIQDYVSEQWSALGMTQQFNAYKEQENIPI